MSGIHFQFACLNLIVTTSCDGECNEASGI